MKQKNRGCKEKLTNTLRILNMRKNATWFWKISINKATKSIKIILPKSKSLFHLSKKRKERKLKESIGCMSLLIKRSDLIMLSEKTNLLKVILILQDKNFILLVNRLTKWKIRLKTWAVESLRPLLNQSIISELRMSLIILFFLLSQDMRFPKKSLSLKSKSFKKNWRKKMSRLSLMKSNLTRKRLKKEVAKKEKFSLIQL